MLERQFAAFAVVNNFFLLVGGHCAETNEMVSDDKKSEFQVNNMFNISVDG